MSRPGRIVRAQGRGSKAGSGFVRLRKVSASTSTCSGFWSISDAFSDSKCPEKKQVATTPAAKNGCTTAKGESGTTYFLVFNRDSSTPCGGWLRSIAPGTCGMTNAVRSKLS